MQEGLSQWDMFIHLLFVIAILCSCFLPAATADCINIIQSPIIHLSGAVSVSHLHISRLLGSRSICKQRHQ